MTLKVQMKLLPQIVSIQRVAQRVVTEKDGVEDICVLEGPNKII